MKLSLNQNHILSTFNIIIQLNYVKSSFYSEVLESLNFYKEISLWRRYYLFNLAPVFIWIFNVFHIIMTTQSAHREQYVLKFHLINLNHERIFILQNSNAEFSSIWGNTLTLGNQTIKIGVFTSRYYHLIQVVDCPLKK